MPTASTPTWLLLAASLPGREANTARVRLWRTLKDLGAASIRDGVTIVPESATTRAGMTDIVTAVERAGGSAWLLTMAPQPADVEAQLRALFDRSESYAALLPSIATLRTALPSLDEAAARQQLREIDAELEATASLDFFPSSAQTRARDAADKIRARINRKFSPTEPSATTGVVKRRKRADFRGQLWATRKRLWVDRAASAWLIRRFVDPKARFRWLDRPADCPPDAHGFDFDGATFTHVGEQVTFEVLIESFALDDAALRRLAELVHVLDVGGEPVAEAAGFEAVLAGLRDTSSDDDALLAAITPVLDALYQHFAHAPR